VQFFPDPGIRRVLDTPFPGCSVAEDYGADILWGQPPRFPLDHGVWVFCATAISGSRKLGHASKASKVIVLSAAKLPTPGRFTALQLLTVRNPCIVCSSVCFYARNVLA
jgi:hypothetical protein